MPRPSLSDDLKDALRQLPAKEKDKLLFRLVPKDDVLREQLEFKLLEESLTTESRRSEIQAAIETELPRIFWDHFSPGYLRMEMRSLSGMITRHLRVTRDKYGEIWLNFRLLNQALDIGRSDLLDWHSKRTDKLYIYIVRRTLKIQKLLDKLHDDVRLDFKEEIEKLDGHIQSIPDLKGIAEKFKLDMNAF